DARRARPRRRTGGRRRERQPGATSATSARDPNADDQFREIIVCAEPHQTRVAIMESGTRVEFMIERPEQRRIVGDNYKGKVTAILPGIQAAFLDIGMEKGAFLHVSDLAPNLDELEL